MGCSSGIQPSARRATRRRTALTYLADRHSDSADATVTLERAALNRMVLREVAFTDAVVRGLVRVDGDGAKGAYAGAARRSSTAWIMTIRPSSRFF